MSVDQHGIRRDARGVYRHRSGRPVSFVAQQALTAAARRPGVSRPSLAQQARAYRAGRLAVELDVELAASYVRDIDATLAADRGRQARSLVADLDAALGRRRRRPARR